MPNIDTEDLEKEPTGNADSPDAHAEKPPIGEQENNKTLDAEKTELNRIKEEWERIAALKNPTQQTQELAGMAFYLNLLDPENRKMVLEHHTELRKEATEAMIMRFRPEKRTKTEISELKEQIGQLTEKIISLENTLTNPTKSEALNMEIRTQNYTLSTGVLSSFFANGWNDQESLQELSQAFAQQEIEIDPAKCMTEFAKIRPDLIENQSEHPEYQEVIENAVHRVLTNHESLNAEVINILISKIKISEKNATNTTGYEEICYYDAHNREIVAHQGTFEADNPDYVLFHECGHALIMEPGLIYENKEFRGLKEALIDPEKSASLPEDLKIMAQMVNNPNKYIGTQGRWIDYRLEELKNKMGDKDVVHLKEAVCHEILADRLASYLASDGSEKIMQLKFLERFPDDAAEEIQKDPTDTAVLFNIALENEAFFNRFNKMISQRKPEELKKIIEGNRTKLENWEEVDDIFDDLYSGLIYEPPTMPQTNNQKGAFSWLWEILAPLKKKI